MTAPPLHVRQAIERLEDENAGLKLDLARAKARITRVTAERNAHQRAYTDADALATQRLAQLDGIGDDLTRRYENALERSEADPGKREHAAAVRAARAALRSYHAIRGTA